MIPELDSIYSTFASALGNESFVAAAIILVSVVLGKAAHTLIKKIGEGFASRTKTRLDDNLIRMLETPVFLAALAVGIYVALSGLAVSQPYLPLLEKTFTVSLLALAFFVVMRTGVILMDWYNEEVAPKTRLDIAEVLPTLKRLWYVIVVAVGGLMVLENLGIEVSPLIASLGIAGLAVALALQDTLGNFFAGIYVTADHPVRKGDYIKLEAGDEGYVEKIGWRSAEVRMLSNNMVIIPNSKLAQSIITNFSRPTRDMAVVIPMSVSYDSDLEKVEKVVVEEAAKTLRTAKGAVTDFTPFIRYNKFADSGIEFSVILRVQEFVDKFLVTHEFIKAVHRRFAHEGIEIPYPKRSVYIESMPDGKGAGRRAGRNG